MNDVQLWHTFWFLSGCAVALLAGYWVEILLEKLYPNSCD